MVFVGGVMKGANRVNAFDNIEKEHLICMENRDRQPFGGWVLPTQPLVCVVFTENILDWPWKEEADGD